MKATTTCVIVTRPVLALAAMLGAATARTETAPVILSDVFGAHQLYRHLRPWPSFLYEMEIRNDYPPQKPTDHAKRV